MTQCIWMDGFIYIGWHCRQIHSQYRERALYINRRNQWAKCPLFGCLHFYVGGKYTIQSRTLTVNPGVRAEALRLHQQKRLSDNYWWTSGSFRILTSLTCWFSSAFNTYDCVLWGCWRRVMKSPPTAQSQSWGLCFKRWPASWTALMCPWINVAVALKSDHGSPTSMFKCLAPSTSRTASMQSCHLDLKRGMSPSWPVQVSQAFVMNFARLKLAEKEHRFILLNIYLGYERLDCFWWVQLYQPSAITAP